MTAAQRRRRFVIILDVLLLLAVILVSSRLLARVQDNYYRKAYPIAYTEAVERESKANNLPPSLVYAVIRTESSFRPDVVSHLDARGLMQITEETYDWTAYRMGEEGGDYDSLFDGDTNIKYGTALLRLLLDEFGSVENALCAYHAGWGNVKSWLGDPEHSADGETIENIPFQVTADYVRKVLEAQAQYQSLYNIP